MDCTLRTSQNWLKPKSELQESTVLLQSSGRAATQSDWSFPLEFVLWWQNWKIEVRFFIYIPASLTAGGDLLVTAGVARWWYYWRMLFCIEFALQEWKDHSFVFCLTESLLGVLQFASYCRILLTCCFSYKGKRVLRNYVRKQIVFPGSPAAVLAVPVSVLCCWGWLGEQAGKDCCHPYLPLTQMQPPKLLETACSGLTGEPSVLVGSWVSHCA